ncbi:NAD-dependent epimerase/dehydratase family protein [Pseudonocardia alni]|uniref:NAD-dependent epimerase/dehydratase family protein n=1 Tax=Pseudonocardia alni TaxID=33907 RepID=UPI0033F56AF2
MDLRDADQPLRARRQLPPRTQPRPPGPHPPLRRGRPLPCPRGRARGTGTPRREFLHVDDLGRAIVHLLDHYDDPQTINVDVGTDVTIRELADRRRVRRRDRPGHQPTRRDTAQAARHQPHYGAGVGADDRAAGRDRRDPPVVRRASRRGAAGGVGVSRTGHTAAGKRCTAVVAEPDARSDRTPALGARAHDSPDMSSINCYFRSANVCDPLSPEVRRPGNETGNRQ